MNIGKKFEQIFKENWIKSFPQGFILRLNDQMSGYKNSSRNICDFICFNENLLFLIECKTIKGNTFSFSNLKQYDKLCGKIGIKGVNAGVVIWFYEKDVVVYVPITTCKQMKEDGEKSINCKKLVDKLYKEDYNIIQIPSVKKRVFMDSDYSVLYREIK